MSLSSLDQDILNKSLKGIYLLYGTETYDIERYIEKIKKCYANLQNGVNLFVLDKSNINDLEDICDSVSFFGLEKLVIVKNVNLKFNLKVLENINNPELVIVFEEESVDKRTTEYKCLSKNANVIEFNKLNEREAIFFVIKTLNSYKIKVTDEVARYMVTVCTEDKQTLINEFRKIVAYLEPGDNLTKEIIDKICCKTLDAVIFDLMDCVSTKKKKQAIGLLEDMLAQKIYIGIIVSALYKQVKQMYQIKLMSEKIKTSGINVDVAKELGIHPFVYEKLRNTSNIYTIASLEKIILAFDEYDEASKTGKIDAAVGLKRLILDM